MPRAAVRRTAGGSRSTALAAVLQRALQAGGSGALASEDYRVPDEPADTPSAEPDDD